MYIYICMCMCICILLFTYASARIYIYNLIYIHIHIQIYYIHLYIYIRIHIHIHIYIYMWYSPKCPPFLFHIWRFGIAWWCRTCNVFVAISPEKNQNSYRAQKEHSTRASNTRAFFWGAEVHNSIQSPCFLAL